MGNFRKQFKMEFSDKEIINQLYSNVFNFSFDKVKNVFLCGAKMDKNETIRNYILEKIRKYPSYNIVFPENLFDSLINNGGFNILELETKLADDADLIIMPLEGYGTFTELGAFSCYDSLRKSLVVISDIEFRGDDSFINLGPIKLIHKQDESHVIYYKKNKSKKIPNKKELDRIFDQLLKVLRYYRSIEDKKGIKNIFGLSRFLLFLIAIYENINLKKINDLFEETYGSKFQFYLIEPSIANLISNGFIKENKTSDLDIDKTYSLSNIGHEFVLENLLDKFNLRKKFSTIKLLYNTIIRKKKKFNLEEEKKRFLDL